MPPITQRRRSLRLEGYDYGGWGPYFASIVVDKRRPLFGEVVDEEMRLNDAGEMAESVWAALPQRFPEVRLDTFVVMPNHIHGSITIDQSDADNRVTLGDVISAYKSLTTVE